MENPHVVIVIQQTIVLPQFGASLCSSTFDSPDPAQSGPLVFIPLDYAAYLCAKANKSVFPSCSASLRVHLFLLLSYFL
jgi:hypothetical protein